MQTQGSGGREEEEKRKFPASQPPPLLSASSEREEGEEEEESIGYAAKSRVQINDGWVKVVKALLLPITYMEWGLVGWLQLGGGLRVVEDIRFS